MPVADHRLAPVLQLVRRILVEKPGQIGFHRPGDEVAGPSPQQIVQRIRDRQFWL